jgi:hypothetical protein
MMTTEQASKRVATDAYNLGRRDAREWFNDPHSKPLALLRLEYQDKVVDACEWGAEHAPSPHVTVVGILDLLAMYGAGVDSIVEEFILLSKATVRGAMQ